MATPNSGTSNFENLEKALIVLRYDVWIVFNGVFCLAKFVSRELFSIFIIYMNVKLKINVKYLFSNSFKANR